MRRAELQTKPGPRPGLLRRILPGGRASPSVRQHLHPDVLDLRGQAPYGLVAADVVARVERLETGMELMAVTMKRALTRLGERTLAGTEEVERMVAVALEPLSGAVAELADQVRRFPADIAAAAAASARPATDPQGVDPDLPATPFELEPLDEGMDALTVLRRARFAQDDQEGLVEATG
jgi:hypothetical protein